MTMPDQVPIMSLGPNLLVTLRGDLDDSSVEEIERVLTRRVSASQASGVLIDVSGLMVIDSYVARVLARQVALIRLLGAAAAVVGIQPAVAITLAELGVPMAGVMTALNADQGMARLGGLHRDRAR
jgi:rsbT antagonist protein RsbS